jgi:chromosome segregation ATPase
MILETWQIVAIVAAAIVVIALIAWLVMSRSRRRTDAGSAHRHSDVDDSLRREIASLREQNQLLAERVDRFERGFGDAREDLSRFRETHEARMQRLESVERNNKELQEQIFELREGQKVLMQRDDRHERAVLDLQEQFSRSTPADGR